MFSKIWGGGLRGYKFMVDTDDSYFKGNYEKDCFSYILSEINKKQGVVIYDLGANLGYISMLSARAGGAGSRVFAFEPIPSNMSILCHHLLINNITNVIPVNIAASDRLGLIDFSADNDSVSYTYQKGSSYYGNKELNIKVATIGLDELIGSFNFPVPDILKIDVEGAEYDVLSGARNLVRDHQPSILLSTHEAHVKGVEEKCIAFIQEMGYTYKRLPNEPGRWDGLNDFWCTPIKNKND